jgi:hypothetical protein
MKYRFRVLLGLLSSLSLQANCQESESIDPESIVEAESQFPFINMLEFLGEFELENGEWISPKTLSNEVFSDMNIENNADERNVLSVPDEDD